MSPQKTLSKSNAKHASTPNLHANRANQGTAKGSAFNLTLKQQMAAVPSQTMALNDAEALVRTAQDRIKKLKEKQAEGGDIDQKLEGALKENKYLQKIVRSMNDVITSLFEKHNPPKSYPITERHKSPPKSA